MVGFEVRKWLAANVRCHIESVRLESVAPDGGGAHYRTCVGRVVVVLRMSGIRPRRAAILAARAARMRPWIIRLHDPAVVW